MQNWRWQNTNLFLDDGKSGVDGLDDGDDEDGANFNVNFGIALDSKLVAS